MSAVIWNRDITDRPNIAVPRKGRVERVPDLLHPYIPLKDWIEFCDELADAHEEDQKELCIGLGRFIGISLFVAGIVLAALGVQGGLVGGIPMIIVGIMIYGASERAYWRSIAKVERMITDACSKVSNKLKTTRIRYVIYCAEVKSKSAESDQTHEIFYQLEVVVTIPTEAGARNTTDFRSDFASAVATQDPFYEAINLPPDSAPVNEDDHWEVLGGTINETPEDFAAAYRAATATAPTEIISGSADDSIGAVTSKATFAEQLESMI